MRGAPIADNFLWRRDQLAEKMCFNAHDFPAPDDPPSEESVRLMFKRQATVAELVWTPRWHDPSLERWISSIASPTAIVGGQDDQLFPIENAKFFADQIPGSKLSVLPECGHLPFLEKSEEVGRLVQRNITGVEA